MTKNRQVCEFHHRPKRGVRRLLCAGSVVAAAALAPTLAAAQEAGEGEGDTIVVSGDRYLSENTRGTTGLPEIGRASCRERVGEYVRISGVAEAKKNNTCKQAYQETQ